LARPIELRSQYQLTARDLAIATGAHERTAKKWEASPDIEIQERYATRLHGLTAVLEAMDGLSLSFVQAWLRMPKPELDGLSPREALGQGRWDEVLQLARITRTGVVPEGLDERLQA
jgi:hypothetical protein